MARTAVKMAITTALAAALLIPALGSAVADNRQNRGPRPYDMALTAACAATDAADVPGLNGTSVRYGAGFIGGSTGQGAYNHYTGGAYPGNGYSGP